MAITNAAILYPVRFSATSALVRVTCNGVTENLTFGPVTVGRDYWLSGDGQADDSDGDGDLVVLLKACLDTHSEADPVFSVSLNASHLVSITHLAAAFSILWSNGLTTLDPTIFGFTDSDTASGTSTTAPNLGQGIWKPARFISKDSCDRQTVVGAVSRSISGLVRTARLALPAKERELMFELVDKANALDRFASGTGPYNTFETAWRDGLSHGRRLRLYENEDDIGDLFVSPEYGVYKVRDLEDPLEQRSSNLNYWNVSLRLVEVE